MGEFAAEYDDQAPVNTPDPENKKEESKDEEVNKDDFKLDFGEDASDDTGRDDSDDDDDDVGEEDISPAMQKAMDEGWRPQDEWEGDPDDWVDFKEFNYRGELFNKIKTMSKADKNKDRRIDKLEAMVRKMGELNKTIAEREFNRAIKALKAQRKDAMEDQDLDKVDEIQEQMEELKQAQKQAEEDVELDLTPAQESQIETPEEVQDWLDDPTNAWYNDSVAMRGAADAHAQTYIAKHYRNDDGNIDPSSIDWTKVLAYADKEIRNDFPHKFNTRRRKAASVTEDTGTRVPKRKNRRSKKDLDSMEYEIGVEWVENEKLMSWDEYIDSLDADTRSTY